LSLVAARTNDHSPDRSREANREQGTIDVSIDRSNIATVAAIAAVAYAACDMTHEALGHGVAALLTGVHLVSLSTVGLGSVESSRMVAAAGPMLNIVAGLLAMIVFRRGTGFGGGRYFLWLFATLNLLNGTGYLTYSGILDFGDWSVVVAGMQPHLLYRIGLVVAGLATYFGSVWYAGMAWVPVVRRDDLNRLVFPAYLAGGLLFVAGAALNPVGPRLIALVGVSSGFGAMLGLLLVPGIVEKRTSSGDAAGGVVAASRGWMVLGILVAVVFVGVVGPGIRLG
jgi:hypothetical protein